MNPILHAIATTPPTSTHDTGQEAIFHEPWQVLLSQLLTLCAVVATAVIAGLNRGKVRKVSEQITANVGTANGSGTLMDQATMNTKRIGQLAEHQYEIKSELVSHVEKAEQRFDSIERALAAAAKQDAVDQLRAQLERAATKDQLQTVETKLDDHVEWEMTQKYAQPALVAEDPPAKTRRGRLRPEDQVDQPKEKP